MSNLGRVSAVGIVSIGILYQALLQPFLHDRFGLNRPIVPLNNQDCEQIPELEACEDVWLHQPSGFLYLTCSSVANRYKWLPSVDQLDTTQVPEDDYVAVVDTKGSGPWKDRITKITPQNFPGHDGKGTFLLHGLGVYLTQTETTSTSTDTSETPSHQNTSIRLFLINHRPQPNAELLGANSTVELFDTTLGSPTMTHIHTFHDPETILTPNNLVPAGPQSFYSTNDHSVRTGHFRKKLDFFIANSALGFCTLRSPPPQPQQAPYENKDNDHKECQRATPSKFKIPNGLAGASQYPAVDPQLLYLTSSSDPFVTVFRINDNDNTLAATQRIRTGYPMDNINMAHDGSLIGIGLPKLLSMSKLLENKGLVGMKVPSVVLRISRDDSGGGAKNESMSTSQGQEAQGKWRVEKIFEDDGAVMSGATSAVLDTQRGLLFMGGVVTPYVTVCKLPNF